MKKLLLAIIIFISGYAVSYATCTQIFVQINGGTSPVNICESTSLTLSGNVTVGSTSINGGFTYSWIKDNTVLQTGTLTPIIGTATAVPSYTGITGLSSDAGDYVLRVEDGNAANFNCYNEAIVRIIVNPKPTITGNLNICPNSTSQLTGSETAATTNAWISATTTVATVSGTGVVTPVTTGTSDITYTTSAGCKQTVTVIVNPMPIISGTLWVCAGSTTKLTGAGIAAATDAWISASPSIATVDNTGLVTGIAVGTSLITYTNSNGCKQALTVTVNPIPTITGDLNVCLGNSTQLNTSTTSSPPNPWTSSTTSVASVNNVGLVKGISAGTSIITNTSNAGCLQSVIVTVVSPPLISGQLEICLGSTTQLTGSGIPAATDVWISASPTIATVDNAGLVTGLATGTSIITYTNAAGCSTAATVTIIGNTSTPSVSISSNQGSTICSGTTVTFKANGVYGGTPTYIWTSSVNGALSATTDTYTSNSLIDGEVISVKMTSSLSCASPATASNSITMHVLPVGVTPSVSIAANQPSICIGVPLTYTATTTNTILSPLYEWFVMSSGNPISQGPPSSANSFTSSTLQPSNDVFVKIKSNDACASTMPVASNSLSILVNTGITAGTIGSDQTICYDAIPAALTELTAPANTYGTLTHIWEAALSSTGPYTTIPDQTGSTFTFSVGLTQDVYIRRRTTDAGTPAPCNEATSNVVHITVRPQLTAGVIGSDETLCAGSAPTLITEISSPTGGTGTYTYQWESSTVAGGPYSNISNATNASYAPGVLNTTMYFRRIETSGSCGFVMSNEVAKEISSPTVIVHIDDPGQLCEGDIFVLKCQGTNMGLTPIYNWYVNNSIIYSTDPSYTPITSIDPLKSGDEMYVELVSENACATSKNSVVSNIVTVDLASCTTSNSPYTENNLSILMQTYVSNSVPNVIDYLYFWSITAPFVITGPNMITANQQNATYSVPNQAGLTYQWSVTGGTIVNGQNTNSVTVDWDNAAIASSNARTTSSAYSISVTKTNAANQSRETNLDITATTTGITQTQAQAGINLFPNPTTGSFSIEMPESGMDVTYEILDLTGASVASGSFTSTESDQTIDANFGAGMYQVILKYNNMVTCARLSKVQ